MLWVEGHMSSYFLLLKMSIPTRLTCRNQSSTSTGERFTRTDRRRCQSLMQCLLKQDRSQSKRLNGKVDFIKRRQIFYEGKTDEVPINYPQPF